MLGNYMLFQGREWYYQNFVTTMLVAIAPTLTLSNMESEDKHSKHPGGSRVKTLGKLIIFCNLKSMYCRVAKKALKSGCCNATRQESSENKIHFIK